MNIEQKAREVAVATKILPSWHSQPCPGCEDIVAAIAAALQSAVAEEREECAKIAKSKATRPGEIIPVKGDVPSFAAGMDTAASRIEAAIRARGQKETA